MAEREAHVVVVPGTYVHVYRVAGGGHHVSATVYEPTLSPGQVVRGERGGHSTFTSTPEHLAPVGVVLPDNLSPAWLGRLGTRALPADMDALPCGEERSRVVTAYHDGQYELAYRLIAQAFPPLGQHLLGRRSMGEIDVYDDPVLAAHVRVLEEQNQTWIPVAPSPEAGEAE